jgi:hypothetical protein
MSPYLFNGYEKLDLIENIMVMDHLVFVSMVFGFLEGGTTKSACIWCALAGAGLMESIDVQTVRAARLARDPARFWPGPSTARHD